MKKSQYSLIGDDYHVNSEKYGSVDKYDWRLNNHISYHPDKPRSVRQRIDTEVLDDEEVEERLLEYLEHMEDFDA